MKNTIANIVAKHFEILFPEDNNIYTAEDLKCLFFYKINLKKKYYNILTMNSKRSMMTCSCSSCFYLIKRACKVGIIKDTH